MNFFIKTYGCSHNQADSLVMSNLLKTQGYLEATNENEADIIIVNTCTVKTPTEQKIKRYIQDNKSKKIIIAGCMTATHKELFKNYSLIGCNNLLDIVKIVKGEMKESLKENNSKIQLLSLSKNEVIEIVPISKGCLGNCTYCATKFARGKLQSYEIKDILIQIKLALKNNKKEFWLTAEDTGCYGLDKGSNLIKLLNEIIKLPGVFKIRLGMINPKYAALYKKELAELLNNEHFFKFIHMPIQSGSDKVLKLMNRYYIKKDFSETINYLREQVKNVTIATDIIIGFPGETKEDFQETYNLIEQTKPEVVNISKYWNRPFTESSKMNEQISSEDKKARAIKLMDLHRKHISQLKRKLGKDYALVDEEGHARTSNYTRINSTKKLGEYYKINITKNNLEIFRTRK
ncbi:MAG: tRNA (N(6)-L-threonylcarbamoyladenosine(37)-C(2))-methylthiotransferase [Candidatus Nanoarchaeia archaeon]|nr:tRNA (N(6)-L-threonylcarbamoyladenosine(37)-C(2))-methylthiotransferase [Candidatus Nanoarchaeia archaeon]